MHTKKASFSSFFTGLQHFNFIELAKIINSRLSDKSADISQLIIYFDNINHLLELQNCYLLITDLVSLKFLYVSPSVLSVTGYTQNEFIKGNVSMFMSNYCPADRNNGQKSLYKILDHQKDSQITEKDEYEYHTTFRFLHSNGYYKWMYNRMYFIEHKYNNNPFVMLSLVTGISPFKRDDNIQFARCKYSAKKSTYINELAEDYIPDYLNVLKPTDIEILRGLAEGLDNEQIARRLNFTEHTIKDYRKKMLKKTWCDNMAELLTFAIKNNLI